MKAMVRREFGAPLVLAEVPIPKACERAGVRGYEIVGYDDSYADWKTAFLHPKQALGIAVQFAQTSARLLAYGWPDSPMVITIDVDPSGAEGPVAIEVASTRPLALPGGPVPALGTTFRLGRP